MAAAYAALVSLMDLIEVIKHSPTPPLSLDQKQGKSLAEKIISLQGFLEDFHSHQEIQALASRIAEAAYAAEDLIESQILIVSEGVSKKKGKKKKRRKIDENEANSADFFEGLQRVIQEMESIEKEAIDFTKKKLRSEENHEAAPPPRPSSFPPHLNTAAAAATMVGFDDVSIQIMDRLTRNNSRRDIIPIVAMGGAGKTTLARNIYNKKLIADHFHTRSWTTISQEFTARGVLSEILRCLKNHSSSEGDLKNKTEEELRVQLYQTLSGRTYLIVLDDVWSIDAWDKVKPSFPENNNGSRIMLTTRLSKLGTEIAGRNSHIIRLDLLDEDKSWDLLCKKAFPDTICPLFLEAIGRTIARNCRGLPLSIVTIAGLLAKSALTEDYWKYVAENLSSIVNSEEDEHCLRTLSLSYTHLPVHLKPCFLYMGLFPEDERIHASHLVELWVAEGFLKPIAGKFLEVVGEDYLNDLVERNLILVDERGSRGKIELCAVHDLLRDLCLREAQKEGFFSIFSTVDNLQGGTTLRQRRIATHGKKDKAPHYDFRPCCSAPFLRSHIYGASESCLFIPLSSARLLRIVTSVEPSTFTLFYEDCPMVNLRFFALNSPVDVIPAIWSMTWNLQTLVLNKGSEPVLDIWSMPRLRHVHIEYAAYLSIPDPGEWRPRLVLENLQTLPMVKNFKFSEEVVERIPNIKELSVSYSVSVKDEDSMGEDYCLDNLGRLKNLEYLSIQFHTRTWRCEWLGGVLRLSYLTKLSLFGVEWDEGLSAAVGGCLAFLEVLRLEEVSFAGGGWFPAEGGFRRLEQLKMMYCYGLERWDADGACFPCLERILIEGDSFLGELPPGVGDIPSLRLITLDYVRDSVVFSAKRMVVEQEEEYGNVTIAVEVFADEEREEILEGLASGNFKVEFFPSLGTIITARKQALDANNSVGVPPTELQTPP